MAPQDQIAVCRKLHGIILFAGLQIRPGMVCVCRMPSANAEFCNGYHERHSGMTRDKSAISIYVYILLPYSWQETNSAMYNIETKCNQS